MRSKVPRCAIADIHTEDLDQALRILCCLLLYCLFVCLLLVVYLLLVVACLLLVILLVALYCLLPVLLWFSVPRCIHRDSCTFKKRGVLTFYQSNGFFYLVLSTFT